MILLIGGCGYIGSAVYLSLVQSYGIDSVDLEKRGNPGILANRKLDYSTLDRPFLQEYDTIVLLAAHSSVGEAKADPRGAFLNNVVGFERLLSNLNLSQRLIYASSSSIYSGFGATGASEDPETTGNMYDFTKFVNDALASMSDIPTYGLRFGTVNGPSPNIRHDLMMNRMVGSALQEGRVVISNPDVGRPILGIGDLCRAIRALIELPGEPGIYNLASFNSTVAHLGATVADELDVPLVLGEPTPTYDFQINTTKFQEAYNFQFVETPVSIVRNLIGAYNGGSR